MIVKRISTNELYHHGIKGQKWGVRRYQNPDGTLTEAGRKRVGYDLKTARKYYYDQNGGAKIMKKHATKVDDRITKQIENSNEYKSYLQEKEKRVLQKYINPDTGHTIVMYKTGKVSKREKKLLNEHIKSAKKIINKEVDSLGDTYLKDMQIERNKKTKYIIDRILKEDAYNAYLGTSYNNKTDKYRTQKQ